MFRMFCAGNEVEVVEAQGCSRIIPGFCSQQWKSFFCNLNCMGECSTFGAKGECRSEDKDCHCTCCF